MLRKILLSMSLIFIFSIGVACAAERTYEVTDGGCIVSLPEQYAVTVVAVSYTHLTLPTN